MALVVITVADGEGGIDVRVAAEPALDASNPELTGAQRVAVSMLRVAMGEPPLKKEKGRIALLS